MLNPLLLSVHGPWYVLYQVLKAVACSSVVKILSPLPNRASVCCSIRQSGMPLVPPAP